VAIGVIFTLSGLAAMVFLVVRYRREEQGQAVDSEQQSMQQPQQQTAGRWTVDALKAKAAAWVPKPQGQRVSTVSPSPLTEEAVQPVYDIEALPKPPVDDEQGKSKGAGTDRGTRVVGTLNG
jgi:hypothetical protein